MSQLKSEQGTQISAKAFGPDSGTSEYHLIIKPSPGLSSFIRQMESIADALDGFMGNHSGFNVVFERWFVSDSASQQHLVEEFRKDADHAVSIIQQPPLDGTKTTLLAILQKDMQSRPIDGQDGLFEVKHGDFRHIRTSSRRSYGISSLNQAKELLIGYSEQLNEMGCSLLDNCIRTWFFVRDIDTNYAGVVNARNNVFAAQGLNTGTHFIASTGIAGESESPQSTVQFEAYAIDGLKEGQVKYIQALDHLNPTYQYGVSFERGTYIDYGNRRDIIISGTASIDNKGKILYQGDILKQTVRVIDNVTALLKNAGSGFDDVMHIIVYLRDIADAAAVSHFFKDHFPDIPTVITYAPVCRPGWLIEIECMAIKTQAIYGIPSY